MNTSRYPLLAGGRAFARTILAAAFGLTTLSAPTTHASVPKPVGGQGWWCESYRCGKADLIDVDLVSATDGWMIEASGADNGTLSHWDGQHWQPAQTPGTGKLRALDMASASEGWAMGSGTVALHWDGVGWTPVGVPSAEIQDVDSLTPTDAWAVGGSCDAAGTVCTSTILHWDGRAWSAVGAPIAYPLLSVDMVSVSDGWAVGGRCVSFATPTAYSCSRVILRWDGSNWTVQLDESGPGTEPFSVVSLADPSTGWILAPDATLMRWNGTNWLPDGQTTYGINSIQSVSADEAWAAGTRVLLRWDGLGWSPVPLTDQENWLAIDVDAAGFGATVGASGAAMSLNGVTWSPMTRFIGGNIVDGVDIVSPTEAWAAGASGLFHWVDNRWTRWPRALDMDYLAALEDVDLVTVDEGWAVGSLGTALHWDGQNWAPATTPTRGTISDVQTISRSSAWAYVSSEVAGVYHGQVLHWEGRDWAATDIPGVTGLPSALAMASDSEGWLATRNGELTHWKNAAWTSVQSPTGNAILGIDVFTLDDIWAVGAHGALLHWDGSKWTLAPSPTTATLFGVAIAAADNGWAVGDGVTLHWDGVNWTSVEPVDRVLDPLYFDVDVAGDSGWIVGYQSLLRLDALHTQYLPTLLAASR